MRKKTQGEWNAYVAAGGSRENQFERLQEVPEEMKDRVISHVRTVNAIKNYYKRNQK